MKQETSSSRQQELGLLNPKITSEFSELNLQFYKQEQVAGKWLILKQSAKSNTCSVRGLRVNRQVKNLRVVTEEDSLVIFLNLFDFITQKGRQ